LTTNSQQSNKTLYAIFNSCQRSFPEDFASGPGGPADPNAYRGNLYGRRLNKSGYDYDWWR